MQKNPYCCCFKKRHDLFQSEQGHERFVYLEHELGLVFSAMCESKEIINGAFQGEIVH